MSLPLKILELLTSAQVGELEEWARERRRTVVEIQGWMEQKGYHISRSAAWKWQRQFNEAETAQRMMGAGSLAKAFLDAAKESGGVAIPDAAVLQLAQMIFESASSQAMNGDVEPQELSTMALALQRLTLAKSRVEDVRRKFLEREAAAVEAAEKHAAAGAGAGDVVETIKVALGITQKAA